MTVRDAGILLGIPIDRKSLSQAVKESVEAIDSRNRQIIFACANPHSIVVAQNDSAFMHTLNSANLVVADGVGVTLMAKLANVSVGPRIAGNDYFQAILCALDQKGGGRVFFFGSSQRVLNLIAERFSREHPALTLCGMLSPPYGEWSSAMNDEMIDKINAAQPDVLWVGMTAPKQEKWVEASSSKLHAPVIGSIGAVFDFYAGTYPRAPVWICYVGMEWLYRLMKEPRRMWRRNFISSPLFVLLVVRRHLLGFAK